MKTRFLTGFLGLAQKREHQDQRGDGDADAQPVAEGLAGIGRVAA